MSDNDIVEPGQGPETPEAGSAAPTPPTGGVAAGSGGDTELRQERNDLYDRLLRKTAEFDNYRKRVERERRELTEWAAADVLGDLLSVIDDFERALATPAPPEAQAYRAGVELIHRQLVDLVRKRGATPIEALGTDFDPHVHQAVAYEETPGAREGEVVGELRKGYKLGERLLRPAMVKVAKAS
ncbi:MAG: nucleotide exchange factor GrpE [Vicinamibacterales bacterium]